MSITKLSEITRPFNNPNLADSVLFEFIDLCCNRHLIYYICFGTALGFYRDKGYIRGDPDIDVFISCDESSRISLLNDLTVNGFSLHAVRPVDTWRNCHTVKNSILLDIWYKQCKDYLSFYHGDNYILYKNRKIRIPANIEKYFYSVYENWRVPSPSRAHPFKPKH